MADLLETHRILTVTKIATVALAAYRLVILSTDAEACEYPAAQYDWCYGVTLHAAAIGKPVSIGVIGVYPVQVNGAAVAISIGDKLGAYNASGYAQDVSGAASRAVLAIALAASTTNGDIIPALFGGHSLTTA